MTKAEAIRKLKGKILAKRPILDELLKRHANVSVAEYNRTLLPSTSPIDAVRKHDFINIFSAEIGKHFSSEVVNSVVRQLESSYMVSTAEHHGPLMHPFFVHSNLLAAHNGQENIIVLGVGNVSLNNSSYPRGLIFHSKDGTKHHLPFFPSPERMFSVFGQRAFGQNDILKLQNLIQNKVRKGELSNALANSLREFINNICNRSEILNLPDYNHQIVKLNSLLWQDFLPLPRAKPPRLLTLQLEDIVLQLLQKHHLFSNTDIYELIFNTNMHRLLIEHADGIPGNFSLADKKGTFLFWYLPSKNNRRQQMWLNGRWLQSAEGFKLKLEPSALEKAIELGKLIPGTFLSLLLLSEYYGVKCLGGFSQGTYLTKTHEVYNIMRKRPAKAFDQSHSTGLRSDFVLAYFKDTLGRLQPATGMDLALHRKAGSWQAFLETANELTLEQAMAPLFPELYLILYSPSERQDELTSLTIYDIIEHYGFAEKIKPTISIDG
ncbi:MAG: hypothetical protein AAB410_00045 [Patescibacteria group bacterium]